jgi:hypothetical protein
MQFTGPLATENFCVAVGSGPNYLAYSYDGLTWTPTPSANPFIDNSNAGIFTSWNGSLWISGGYDDTTSYNTLAYSSDGIHWLSGEGSAFDSYFNCAAWNGTMWIGGGYDDGSGVTLASSYDGIHWTAVNFDDFSVCLGIAWNGTMWVAVGVSPFGPSGIYYSYDGFNWTGANVDYVVQCIAWNGKMWVAGAIDVGSAYETIFYSYDGINWNLANSSLEKNCFCIAWNGSVWVAGAGEGPNNPNPNTPYETIAYSTDGINWSLSESVFEFACSSVAWNGSVFIVTGDDNVNSLGYSYNGDLFFPIANSVFSPGPYGGFGVSSRKVLPYVGTSPIPFTRMSTIAYGAGAGGIGQGLNAIAIGYNAGLSTQGVYSIAVGVGAGITCQGSNAVAVGAAAGLTYQSTNAVAIGAGAGQDYQGPNSVAVGTSAGLTYQGSNAVAVGFSAGITYQSDYSIAMGYLAGSGYQSTNAIAIGHSAGNTNQGAYTIALGSYAGLSNQHDNTIVLNATGVDFNTIGSNSFYVSPIRSDVGASNGNLLYYDTGTGEIIYDTTKTFVINHPKDESKYLVHACLEGPEAGVYYRGTGTIAELETSVEVELPDYVDALAVDLTVQVTPIYNGSVRVLNASCVSNNKFTVYGDSGDFHWHVYGRRAAVVVEPKKSDVAVLGEGPYRWIA